MGFIPDNVIDDVRMRADIVEVISEYLPLKKAGANYRALCPFHDEKTPSFNVNPQKQIFHCFGCQEGGNVFTFIMKHESVSFPEAVRRLADRYGIKIPENRDNRENSEIEKLHQAMAGAAEIYHDILIKLDENSPVKRYLEKRNVPQKIVDTFRLGWAPDSWDTLTKRLTSKGFNPKILEKAGLSSLSSRGTYIDRFRGRLIFPISNPAGRVIGFGGRIIGDAEKQAKYINSPETPIYNKSRVLFGFDKAREAARKMGVMIVVEGYMDVIALHKAGIENQVACSGVALTGGQTGLIKRVCDTVVMLFDSDKAGSEAAKRGGSVILDHGIKAKVLFLTDAKDPDEFLSTHSPDDLARLIKNAPPFIQFIIERAVNEADLSNIDNRVSVIGEVIPYLTRIQDDIERAHYTELLAEKTGTDAALLARKVAQKETRKEGLKRDLAPKKEKKTAHANAQKILIRILLDNPGYLQDVAADLAVDDFDDPVLKAIFSLIKEGAGKGSAGAAEFLDFTDDEKLKSSISSLTMDRSLLLEEGDIKTTFKECVKKLRYRPEERRRLKEIMKEKVKEALAQGESKKYNEAKEKYLQSR